MLKYLLMLVLVTAATSEMSFRVITVKHVYVGGISSLFKNSGDIRTEPFITPAFNQKNNNQLLFK